MHTEILEINQDRCVVCQVETRLSFKPLVNHLKERLKTEHPIKAQFYKFLLEKLSELEASDYIIRVADIDQHQETLVLIYTILTPLVASEKEFFWAMSTPVPDKIFFSTDAFFDFYTNKSHVAHVEGYEEEDHIQKKQLQFIYQLILKRFYNFTSIFKDEKILNYTDPVTHISKYYSIHADTSFIDIHVDGELPTLDFEAIGEQMHEGKELEILVELLPLHLFKLEGFTILTLTDITMTKAIDNLRSILVEHTDEREAYPQVIQSLKTLAGNADIEFGVMPFLTLNDKLVFDTDECQDSVLINAAAEAGIADEVLYALVEEYRKNPRPIIYTKITDEKAVDNVVLRIIKKAGVTAYTLIPIYYNKKLAGAMELHSKKELIIDEVLLSKLQRAIPLLAQLFQYSIDRFNSAIDVILKDKFTALQPSVQWKFNEVALTYLRGLKTSDRIPTIDTVVFEDMYPLFGAIDIRNSTIERNVALQEDLKQLLNVLGDTLKTVKEHVDMSLIDKLLYNVQEWKIRISEYTNANDEVMLRAFLDTEVDPLLKHIRTGHPATANIINEYFNSVREESGIAYQKRRELEASMQLINTSVSHYLEKAQAMLQKSYPCYFSKFRTDGVEYDIYIGQSIAPEMPFNNVYLKNLRLWQIRSMVEIARLTAGLAKDMVKPLHTTHMIFIHSNPINISFRNDERRFDVEGAYNIRYEVVKKRIDKVLIKGTTERLTQPGKVALVYFNQQEANEYLEYIQYLQEQGYLTGEVEQLELEELQGVSGLKAIRAGVKYIE
ncbi:GAF domain-containing protein [Mucilaginibacter sp. JRF]|uniref:GAF domain-containing protein n=1 Tax=Mucilaginibacter sp. JRF TaxID=2780088 RepID=UPI001881AF7C|nr:GAF domain-containing protein [Mucilaginibacter sp. JRF]MBE9585205.1 GAF domain-containing protein [Mucilaginibacter sp. JRF]